LFSHPQDFETWDILMSGGVPALAQEGKALVRVRQQQVALLVKEARQALFGKWIFPAVNAPHFIASDVGHALLQAFPDAPFAGVYRDAGDGMRLWSLRSADGREDVAKVTGMTPNGGGHRNAAGMQEPAPFTYVHFLR
jgi:hypothetical protein